MTREQIIKQIEIYLKREKAQLDSLEDAIKTTSSDYQAATENNAQSRLLRYLKVDVEAAYESKLKIQEAELYPLLGRTLEIRDEHVAHASNREDLIARRIASLVSGSGDTISRKPASHKKPDDLSKVQAKAASHPEFSNDKERDLFRLNSIKQIGLAMHNFADMYRTFPGHANLKHGVSTNYRDASVVVQPFSWRVAILPYIEEQELFNHYRFDELWDSEHNRQLIDKMPAFFRSPFAPESQPAGHTNIQGFATKRGLMEPANGSSFDSVTDGLSNTILAVETAESVPWTKPVDLTTTKVKLIGKHPLLVLIGDGSVDVIAQPIDQNKLDKMITRDGGEVVR